MTLRRIASAALFLLLLIPAHGLAAQSLFSARGLGYPLDPIDSRSRGLGGVSLGLGAGEISWTSPASVIGLPAPGLVAAYQYDQFTNDDAATDFTGQTARFPLILAAFPIADRFVAIAGYGAYLDQNWRLEQADTLTLGGEDVGIVDRNSSEGGIARLRTGAAMEIIEGLGIGLTLDGYTGSVDRVRGRLFPGEATPGCCLSSWSYTGLGYSAGIHYSAGDAFSVAGSASYGGTLKATSSDSLGTTTEYELPMLVRVGASARLAQNLLLAAGGSWDGWSSVDADLGTGAEVQDSWTAHGGLEWDGMSFRDRPLPIRLGYRSGKLPFATEGVTDGATEQAFTGGAGVLLGGGSIRSDFSIEVGSRSGEALPVLNESFWRFGFSVRILGS